MISYGVSADEMSVDGPVFVPASPGYSRVGQDNPPGVARLIPNKPRVTPERVVTA